MEGLSVLIAPSNTVNDLTLNVSMACTLTKSVAGRRPIPIFVGPSAQEPAKKATAVKSIRRKGLKNLKKAEINLKRELLL
jgi:hypothetical protein